MGRSRVYAPFSCYLFSMQIFSLKFFWKITIPKKNFFPKRHENNKKPRKLWRRSEKISTSKGKYKERKRRKKEKNIQEIKKKIHKNKKEKINENNKKKRKK
jgi:hypothetical protein